MAGETLTFAEPVTLVGGGTLDAGMLAEACALAPVLVAADRAADRLAAYALEPVAVIGDMDSLGSADEWRARGVRVLHLAEQDTTDFEKCLYSIDAPFFVGAGFTGRRMDHTLAVLHGMLRWPDKQVFLLGEIEVMTFVPPGRILSIPVDWGDKVSLFPVLPARCTASRGLEWPIDGLEMAAGAAIGTSNRAKADQIEIAVEDPGVLLTIPRRHLAALVNAVRIAAEAA